MRCALGGAASIDRYLRSRKTWWPEERITGRDLKEPGVGRADNMVGHDAPLDVPALDRFLATTTHQWPWDMIDYADRMRSRFHEGFMNVRRARGVKQPEDPELAFPSRMRRDGNLLRLLRIIQLEVGIPAVLDVEPLGDPAVVVFARRTTTYVTEIRQLDSEPREKADG